MPRRSKLTTSRSQSCSPSCPRSCGGRRSRTRRGSSTAPTSYERLAFLGDVVLSLAVSTHLFPRFERYGAGRLTKVRAQAVSGASCARVAREPRRAGASCAPRRREGSTGRSADMLVDVRARARLDLRGDHRRRLPRVRLRAHRARRWWSRSRTRSRRRSSTRSTTSRCSRSGSPAGPRSSTYQTVAEEGPAHDRSFVAVAEVDGRGAGPRRGKDEEGRRAGSRPAGSRRAR